MSVCLLSDEEVGRLLNYGLLPSHKAHRHLKLLSAVQQIIRGKMEIVEHKGEQYGICRPKLHNLAVRPSGYVPVVQRIRSNRPKFITPPKEMDLSKE